MRAKTFFRNMGLVLGLVVLAACVRDDRLYGHSAGYGRSYNEKIEVTIPPEAPSITQQYRRKDPVVHRDVPWGEHLGLDVHAPVGTPVIAAGPGRVVHSFFEPMYGNRVVIDHGNDENGLRIWTRYMHLKARTVEKGDVVERGAQIGELGVTGVLSSGFPHLHYEVKRERPPQWVRAIDPNLAWAGGVGQVTCLKDVDAGALRGTQMTYPVRCR